jgi:hypothetical protein
MSPAKVPAAILPTLLVLLLSSACFEHPSQAITRHTSAKCSPAAGFGGANEQAIPAAFPKDFPVYPGARFVAATHSAARDSVTWTSKAATGSIRDFYEKQLQSGDWQLYGDQYSDPCEAYWHVERRSNANYGGVLSFYSGPAGGNPKFINAELGKK